VYYAEISASKEMKKRQQRVMMILDSKVIPYEAIDITEPGKEPDKDFMLNNAKPRGDTKKVFSPQIFNGEQYCGDYEDFDLANENDVLEEFLNVPKVERKFSTQTSVNNGAVSNGKNSRESSAEAESKKLKSDAKEQSPAPAAEPAPAPPQLVPAAAAAAAAAAVDLDDDGGFDEKNIDVAEGKSNEGDVSSTTTTPQDEAPHNEPIPAAAAGDDQVDDGIEDELSED
jgi:hypothetical protein